MSALEAQAQIEQQWVKDLESNATEAVMRRGQWLLPRFVGMRRISRRTKGQQVEAMRKADITDPSCMEMLLKEGPGPAADANWKDNLYKQTPLFWAAWGGGGGVGGGGWGTNMSLGGCRKNRARWILP